MNSIKDNNTFTSIAKIMSWKINVYFIIMLIMFVLNIFMLRNISNQIYWHNKTSLEAMACVQDKDCSINSAIEAIDEAEHDYYPPEYID